MKFLVDENLSPLVATGPRDAGHDAVHAGDVDLRTASDNAAIEFARENRFVVVSADTDFGTLLAATGSSAPSDMN